MNSTWRETLYGSLDKKLSVEGDPNVNTKWNPRKYKKYRSKERCPKMYHIDVVIFWQRTALVGLKDKGNIYIVEHLIDKKSYKLGYRVLKTIYQRS